MSFSNTDLKVPYDCNGSVTGFPITIPYLDDVDLLVVRYDSVQKIEIVLVLNTDFTIVAGNVVTGATFPSGDKITIGRKMTLDQPLDLPTVGSINLKTFERFFDKIVMITQQIKEQIDRTVKLAFTDDGNLELPLLSTGYGKYLWIDETGKAIWKTGTIPDSETISAEDIPIIDAIGKFAATDVEGALAEGINNRVDVTANITLAVGEIYLVSGNFDLTLPSNASKGNIINILSDGYPKIIQNDVEHVLSLRNKYFTTKGVNGFIQMFPRERLELVYKGSGLSPIEPVVKLSNPPTLPASHGNEVAFSYDGTYMAVAHYTTPFITIYKRNGDTFTKLPDPSSLPANNGTGVAFSYDGTYMAVASEGSPYLTIYKRDGDTFNKLPNPSSLPVPFGYGITFSYDGIYMVLVNSNSPYLTIYKRSGDTFTKLSNPSSLPTNIGNEVAFSYDGTYMAVAHNDSPYITIYKRNGDTFTKLDNPSILPTDNGRGVAFSYDGTYMIVAHDTTPYVTIYKRSGDTFIKLPNPSNLPTGDAYGVAFSYDGTYMAVAHYASPYITIYKTKEVVEKEWIVTDFEVKNPEDPSDGDNGDLQYRFK